jgi:peptidoglycan L-alanyl-D-glutamate endopeptidase CwlK
MTDRSLDDLHPQLRPLCVNFLAECKTEGLNVIVTETWRDPAREDALHAEGVTAATGATTKHSFMLNGRPASKAFDYAVLDEDNRMVQDGTDERYSLTGLIAGKLGLIWGGHFSHPDYDHCEIP